MFKRRGSKTPQELRSVEERLRRERPVADPDVLDRIEADVVARAESTRTRTTETPRRTRIAIVGLLAGGMLLSGAGAGLAITGPSLSGSAGQAQYTPPPSTVTTSSVPLDTTGGDVLGNPPPTTTVPDPTTPVQTTPDPTTPPDTTDPGSDPPTRDGDTDDVNTVVEEGAQIEATSRTKELPFTGLAAIPVILAGLVLMAAGLLLRRSADRTSRRAL